MFVNKRKRNGRKGTSGGKRSLTSRRRSPKTLLSVLLIKFHRIIYKVKKKWKRSNLKTPNFSLRDNWRTNNKLINRPKLIIFIMIKETVPMRYRLMQMSHRET
jgi:hypothetical protein